MKNRRLSRLKSKKKKIVVLTAHDYAIARILNNSDVDAVLVGDSLAMVALGYPNTRSISMPEMLHHIKAVRRGCPDKLIVGDLPFLGVCRGARHALASSKLFMSNGLCDAVKLEWGPSAIQSALLLSKHKIPFIGHTGLTPQQVIKSSDFKVKGATAVLAKNIFEQSLAFEKAGAFALVLECVPSQLAQWVTRKLSIPVIGIGAGSFCDGQVLVTHDLLGLFGDFKPRFVKRYLDLSKAYQEAIHSFCVDVRQGVFPNQEQSYHMSTVEISALNNLLQKTIAKAGKKIV